MFNGWNTEQFYTPSSSKWLFPIKESESKVFNLFNSFSTITCFVLFEAIFLLRIDNLASKSVFAAKFACVNIALKTSVVSIYLSWLWLLSLFSISVTLVL